jgi:hypothetical protein
MNDFLILNNLNKIFKISFLLVLKYGENKIIIK